MQAQTAQPSLQAKCLHHAVKKASAEELQESGRDTQTSEPRIGVSAAMCKHKLHSTLCRQSACSIKSQGLCREAPMQAQWTFVRA